MKNILTCSVILFLFALQGCGRDEKIMERNFSSLQGCLYSMQQVSDGPLDIVINSPETVSGRFANEEYFGCERMITGTKGIYYYGYYFVLNSPK